MDKMERRACLIELRQGDDKKLRGYAAVFNSYSEEMWGFKEKIMPGAFRDAIAKSDVRALWNHNPDYVLGRNRSGTLTLNEDEKGLYIEIDPPDTQWARDLLVTINRGDVNQMSFAFTVDKANWDEVDDGMAVRTIEKIRELYDVSPVTYPAYSDTDIGLRSAKDILDEYRGQKQSRESVDILKLKLELKNREV